MNPAPQKWPERTEPEISELLTTVHVVASSPFWLPFSLKIRLACVVDGKVKRAMPERVVAVSSVFTPL